MRENCNFLQPCYIKKNTQELRDELRKLGLRCCNGKAWGKYLCTFYNPYLHEMMFVGSPEWDLKNNPSILTSIDCGTNEDLFLAIAALRNDTDKYQWFVNNTYNKLWCLCIENTFHFETYPDLHTCASFISLGECVDAKDEWHKAAVRELIEHFKI